MNGPSDGNAKSPAVSPRIFVLGLLALTACGAWLRFDGLTARQLWLDECCTFYWAHHLLDWPAGGPDPWSEPAHLPYFLLLHLWTWVAGDTAGGLRSFSAVFGCAAVIVIGGVGARIGGRTVGLMAAALAAVHPLHVYYSQEARCYTLWSVEIALCLYALFLAARTSRARWWAAYGALAWVTVTTHYYALLWLPGTLGVALVAVNAKRCLRQWLRTHVALGVALMPVVWFWILPYLNTGAKGWKHAMWLSYPPALAVPKSLWALMPSGGYPAAYLAPLAASGSAAETILRVPIGPVVKWAPAVVVSALAGAFLASRRRRAHPCEREEAGREREVRDLAPRGPAMAFLLSVSLAFFVAAASQSWILGQGFLVARYDLAAWPSLIIAIALLIDDAARRRPPRRPRRIVARAAIASLLACSGVTLLGLRSLPIDNDAPTRARRVAAAVGPDDLLISVGLYRWFLLYEWHQLGFHTRVLSFPPAHDRQLCWEYAEDELTDPDRIAADVRYVTSEIEQALAGGTRVWLLAHGEPEGPRWEVDRHFFADLRDHGIDVQPRDDWLGLARLVREIDTSMQLTDS